MTENERSGFKLGNPPPSLSEIFFYFSRLNSHIALGKHQLIKNDWGKDEKIKTDAHEWYLFSHPGFLSEKSLKTAYNLHFKIVSNSFVAYDGLKDVKVLKKNFEPADIQVAMSILLRNRYSNTDIS